MKNPHPVILYIEDDLESGRLVQQILRRCDVRVANSAEEGLTMLKIINPPPDLLITDINLPDLQGPDVVVSLKSAGYKNPIVALTAQSLMEEQMLELGCDAFFQKPITDSAAFKEAIANLLYNSRPKTETGELVSRSTLQAHRQHSVDLIARLQQRNKELEEAYQQILRFDSIKADLLSIIGHELRTPVTVVAGYNQLLLTLINAAPGSQEETIIREVNSGLTRLKTVAEETILIARLYTGAQDISWKTADWINLVQEQIKTARDEITKHRRQITVTLETSLSNCDIPTDPHMSGFAVMALLSNAVKQTPDGGTVAVNIYTEAGFIVTQISDEGDGVSNPTHLLNRQITIEHDTLNHSTGKWRYKGNGLGIGIPATVRITELLGGEIKCENTPNGAKFTLMFPLRQQQYTSHIH